MGRISDLLRDTGAITLDIDLRTGDFSDKSQYNNVVNVVGTPTWTTTPRGYGLAFAGNARLTVPSSVYTQTPGTIIALVQKGPSFQSKYGFIVSKRDATGVEYDLAYEGVLKLYLSTGDTTRSLLANQSDGIVVVPSVLRATTEFGSTNAAALPLTPSARDLSIGSIYTGTIYGWQAAINKVALLNVALSQTQAQDLLTELLSERFPTRAYSYQRTIITPKDPPGARATFKCKLDEPVNRTVIDASGNNKNGTLVGTCIKQSNGLYVQGGNAGYINFGNITELNSATKATIYIVADPRNDGVNTFAPYISRGTSDTNRIGIYHGNTPTTVQFSASNGSNGYKELAGLPNKINHLCLSYDGSRAGAGERVHTYIDGKKVNSTLVSDFPASLPSLTADLRIGQFTYADTIESRNKYKFVGIYPEALNEGQVRDIYKQFSKITNHINIDNIPTWMVLNTTSKQPISNTMRLETGSATVRPFGTKTNGINLLTDGDMEAAGTASWIAAGGAVISKASPGYSGNQCLRISRATAGYPFVSNTPNQIVAGKTYRVTGQARGDGSSRLMIGDGQAASNVIMLPITTSWMSFDTIFCPVSGGFNIGAQTYIDNSYIEYDNITVEEVIEFPYKNITKLLFQNEALIYWKENSLYGSRRFSFYSGNACYIGIGSANKILSNSAQNAYFIVPAYNTIQLYKSIAGTFTLLATANITPANYYDVQWNVEYDGKITLWYKDKFTPNWSFGFTVTDTGITSINYGLLDLPASNSHVFGEILTNEIAITPEEWGDGKIVPPNILYKFDADDYATTGDVTSGELGSSGWIVGTGTWAITNVSGKNWIESRITNVSQYVYYAINQSSYGTWIYSMLKTGNAECQFAINDRPGMPWATAGSNGYWVQNNANNYIGFHRTIAGVNTIQNLTANNYLVNNNIYRICFTRDYNGVTTVYVIGGSFTSWTKIAPSGVTTNPVTINDVNPTQYLCLHGSLAGTRFSDIIHIEQVINPTVTPELIPSI